MAWDAFTDVNHCSISLLLIIFRQNSLLFSKIAQCI